MASGSGLLIWSGVVSCTPSLGHWYDVITDSLCSAKYPLAVISKVLEEFDPGTVIGSDIACSLRKTAESSSLGPEIARKLLALIVNAFHGHTHNWACQLKNHPNITEGAGLEDFETMERQFSGSNHLAPITRFASAYRRSLLFEAYCRQWDEDRNLSLSYFLLQNVKQALKTIKEDT